MRPPIKPDQLYPVPAKVPPWRTENDCLRRTATLGDILTEQSIIEGGNGLWTRVFTQYRIVPDRRRNHEGTRNQHLTSLMPGQVKTRDQALKWADEIWTEAARLVPS